MTSRFEVSDTVLPGLRVLQRKVVTDGRGYFERIFCAEDLRAHLGMRQVLQINHTLTTKRGTVRGMHFQHPPHAELKVVSCLRGGVFDVAVDLRQDSPTYMKWHGEVLNADNHRTLLIPEGFAHGFQALTDDCELLYLHTATYEPLAEGRANALDPRLGIAWPLEVSERSARDASIPMLSEGFPGIRL